MRMLPPVLLLLVSLPAQANDGRNRYEGPVPTTLLHVFSPVSPQAGFRVLPGDMPGGADGDPAYRWTTRHAAALARLSCRATVRAFGPEAHPLALFDLSAENGDTPVDFGEKGPRGRHPGGSHDGGLNLDLGYYLNSEKGLHESPDPAACSEHHEKAAAGEKPKDANQCLGPPDRLDVDRQTLFLLELVRAHKERFGGELLEAIGIDARVRGEVLARARAYKKGGRFAVTDALISEMDRLFSSSPYEGWARYHHHHVHVRLLALYPAGRHARAMDVLIEADRKLEGELLLLSGDAGAKEGVALLAELSSQALERTLDLRLIGEPRALGRVRALRLRLGTGAWQAPEDPLSPLHHVADVAAAREDGKLMAEAEVTLQGGAMMMLRREVFLPRQAPALRVRTDGARLSGTVQRAGASLTVALSFPPAWSTLVSKATVVIYRRGREPERIEVKAPTFATQMPVGAPPIELVEADLTLSGRMHLRAPLLLGP